ncbi:hypothetical protein ACIRRH_41885 [Kitasatospora sp. NPDC101235]|uniref:hypothetical protein n=1 Tax=Kitasatospora sp. NPDC101235 TaxID=3364101 RepID=UPI0037F80609
MTVPSADEPAPATALTKLTELRDLAAQALECWQNGDQKAAFDAVNASMPVAAAAAAALNVLIDLDHPPAAEDQTTDDNVTDAARQAVRSAADRLVQDADALNMASAEARQAGLEVRTEDFRRAVVIAWQHGVDVPAIAADAGLETASVEQWIAGHDLGSQGGTPPAG